MSLSANDKVSSQVCILCGAEPASSGQGDHIPPRCLYTKGERTAARFQFHTIPACNKCNGAGAKHDEALKLFISLETGEYRQEPIEVIDTMARTIAGNRRLAGQIFGTARKVLIQDESGIRLPAVSVELDADSYKASVARIARAMYWRMTRTVLPVSANIVVSPLRQLGRAIVLQLQELQCVFPLFEVNGGSLKCKLLIGDEGSELLLMQFFDRHTAVALIHQDITSASSRPDEPSAYPAD